MPYHCAELTVFTQRNFVADFLQAKCDFRWQSAGRFAFLSRVGSIYITIYIGYFRLKISDIFVQKYGIFSIFSINTIEKKFLFNVTHHTLWLCFDFSLDFKNILSMPYLLFCQCSLHSYHLHKCWNCTASHIVTMFWF